jgi:thiol-disulfide isomerase/thioredoxin
VNKWFGLVLAASFLLTGCTPAGPPSTKSPAAGQEPIGAELPAPAHPGSELLRDLGSAPELTNTTWINVDGPLRLADLRGKVVLLEMWTYGCYNCRNTIPSLREWHARYQDAGLVIIANHYPEFSYEYDLDNLKEAVQDLEIEYAVAQDNDGETWRAYRNRYWPTLYLIDKSGRIRYTHIGEGRYAETEQAIQALLAESPATQ